MKNTLRVILRWGHDDDDNDNNDDDENDDNGDDEVDDPAHLRLGVNGAPPL